LEGDTGGEIPVGKWVNEGNNTNDENYIVEWISFTETHVTFYSNIKRNLIFNGFFEIDKEESVIKITR